MMWMESATAIPIRIVARDGNATLIVAELLDQEAAQSTYDEILAVVAETPVTAGNEVHVAGEGAISGYLATYIDRDATRLNPLAAVVITIVLFIAFRTFAGAMLPNIIVLGTLAATFGSMAAFGVSFYVITNGLASFMPQIHKYTSSDAFIAKDDPVVLYREHVRDIFGLEDPIVVAVINDGP